MYLVDRYFICRCSLQFTSGPERFAPQPDVRFAYKGTPAELELDVLKAAESLEGPVAIEFEVNSFPSYR